MALTADLGFDLPARLAAQTLATDEAVCLKQIPDDGGAQSDRDWALSLCLDQVGEAHLNQGRMAAP